MFRDIGSAFHVWGGGEDCRLIPTAAQSRQARGRPLRVDIVLTGPAEDQLVHVELRGEEQRGGDVRTERRCQIPGDSRG